MIVSGKNEIPGGASSAQKSLGKIASVPALAFFRLYDQRHDVFDEVYSITCLAKRMQEKKICHTKVFPFFL